MIDRQWMERMFDLCDEANVERGLRIWRLRQVDAIRYRSGLAVTRVLDRGTLHQVVLDTKQPAFSRCACGAEMCAHVVAAAVQLLRISGISEETIRQTFTLRKEAEPNDFGPFSPAKRAAAAAGTDEGEHDAPHEGWKDIRLTVDGRDEDAELTPTADGGAWLDRWIRTLDNVWRPLAHAAARQRFERFRELRDRLVAHVHPDPVMQDLFRIAAILYPIHRWFHSAQGARAGYSYARASEAMHQLDIGYDEMVRVLERHNSNWEPFRAGKYETVLDALADFLHRCVFAERGLDKWFFHYQLLWGTVLNAPARVERERNRLAQWLENDELPRSTSALAHKAMGHFAVMDGRDEEARRWFEASGHFPYAQGMLYLRSFLARQENERFVSWLSWYEDRIFREHRDELPQYLNGWMHARAIGYTEECLAAMRRMLPYSYYHYESILREEWRGKEWVELHMALKLPPLGMEPGRWKMWEKRHPEWLLPWFHQAVEMSVSRKNREGYRHAVRYLKKLRQLYARLDKHRQWDLYMEKLTKKYKRLRLFQSELQKGKLA